jgi:hypothetical protein
MMFRNFLRLVLLGNALIHIANPSNLLRSGIRALRFGLGLTITAVVFTTVAAAQLTSTPPSPNAPSVYTGDTVILTVTASGQQGAVTFIWQFSSNGANYVTLNNGLQASGSTISGSSSPTLVITNAQAGDTGRYRCLLSDSASNINSGPGTLTVTLPDPPSVMPLSDQIVPRGDTVNFSVGAGGLGHLIYQWQVSIPAGVTFVNVAEGGRISGSTTPVLQITNAQPSDVGWYRCLVSNAGGQVNSGRGILTVLASPPANLTAAAFSSSAVNLSWTNTDPNAAYVVIERAPAMTNAFALVVQASAQLTNYQDQGASPATAYNYRAYAMYSTDSLSGPHAYSNVTSATTMSATLPPTGLVAAPFSSTQINLSWTNHDSTATAVVVERQSITTSVATPFGQIASLSGQATTYQDNNNNAGLPTQTAFNYRVYAVSPRGNSVYSNTSDTTTLAPPVAPVSLLAATISPTEIDLSWNNSDPTVMNYLIERQTGGGSFLAIANVAGVATHSYQDLNAAAATQYMYRMRAQSPTGISAYTDPVSATTSPAPPAPINFAAIGTPAEIDLTWRNPAGGFTKIQIDRKQADHAAWVPVATLFPPAASFNDTTVTPGAVYTYRIYNLDQAGNQSATVFSFSAQTSAVPAPTDLVTTKVTAAQINLQWNNAYSGYTALHLYLNGPNDSFRFKLTDLPGTATSYVFVGPPASTFSFSLQAEVSGLLSAFSNDVVATTSQKITIFFVHGTAQSAGALDALAAALQSAIDPDGDIYNFDTGFDWSRCTITGGKSQRFPLTPLPTGEDGVPAPPHPPGVDYNPCPNNCNVSDGARDLANYIARKNPPGDVFLIAYSLGGNVTRDMIEGQPGSGIGQPGHKLLGLVTLASGSNGYPYEYPWDNLALCNGLAKEVASDTRGNPSYPYSDYIPSINHNWFASPLGGAGYQTFPWMVAAGTFCKSPTRFPDSTQNGCPAGSSNDGIVCVDSVLLNGVAGGTFNRPTTVFTSDSYSHSADSDWISQFFVFARNSNGDRAAFYGGHCNMPDHISLWNPGAGSSLTLQLINFIQSNTP